MSMIPTNTLVIVADGGDAHVFRNIGDSHSLKLKQEEVVTPDSHSHHGPSGTHTHGTDRDEHEFVHQLALRINNLALRHKFEHLILVADPVTLGELRKQLHKEVQSRLLAEVAKDWTHMDHSHLEAALAKLKIGA